MLTRFMLTAFWRSSLYFKLSDFKLGVLGKCNAIILAEWIWMYYLTKQRGRQSSYLITLGISLCVDANIEALRMLAGQNYRNSRY
jgi:hypothetical protein